MGAPLMGMYDEFEIKDYKCKCGHVFTDNWQTKSLMRILEFYKVDDDIRRGEYHEWVFDDYKYSVFELHRNCPNCKEWLSVYGEIVDFIYKGLYDSEGEGKKLIKCPWCQHKL